jgi:hypothetical protein
MGASTVGLTLADRIDYSPNFVRIWIIDILPLVAFCALSKDIIYRFESYIHRCPLAPHILQLLQYDTRHQSQANVSENAISQGNSQPSDPDASSSSDNTKYHAPEVRRQSVGVDDSSTYRLGSVVVAHPSRIRDVPGSIPGLAYLFSSYTVHKQGL